MGIILRATHSNFKQQQKVRVFQMDFFLPPTCGFRLAPAMSNMSFARLVRGALLKSHEMAQILREGETGGGLAYSDVPFSCSGGDAERCETRFIDTWLARRN